MSLVLSDTLNVENLWLSALFEPASVQRDFQWRQEHIGQLLTDLLRSMEAGAEQYFVGPVVIRRDGPRLVVYDGLQRLTALTIIMCILRDAMEDRQVAARLETCINERARPRLSLPNAEPALSVELQKPGEAIKHRRRHLQSEAAIRVRFAANEMRRRILALKPDIQAALGVYILHHTYMIAVQVRDVDVARQIFVTTNNRGLSLSERDVFKGQLAELASADKHGDAIMDQWREMERSDASLDDFLHALDFRIRRETYGDGNLLKLADHLRAKQADEETVWLSEWMEDVRLQFSAWEKISSGFTGKEMRRANRSLDKLRLLPWHEWQALAIQYALKLDDAEGAAPGPAQITKFTERMEGLSRASIALHLSGYEPSRLATIFSRALSEFSRGSNPLTNSLILKDTQLARLKDSLIGDQMNHKTSLVTLRWLEMDMAGDGPIAHLRQPTSVEHVLPRRTKPGSQWQWDFPDEEARHTACHSLGNLCLLPYHFNADDLADKDFAGKKAAFENASKAYQLDQYRLLPSVFENGAWTFAHISDRSEWMRSEILKRLELA